MAEGSAGLRQRCGVAKRLRDPGAVFRKSDTERANSGAADSAGSKSEHRYSRCADGAAPFRNARAPADSPAGRKKAGGEGSVDQSADRKAGSHPARRRPR